MDISILIVDDDKLVVEKLVEGVNWKQLGIGIVLTAYNIRQAKEILEEARVDILLSDIEMPQGSGLELLEWVRNKEIPVECIFLSSYAYFAYAQKAINLKSREYMLKPVSNRELEEALGSIVEILQKNGKNREKGRTKNQPFGRGIFCRKTTAGLSLRKVIKRGYAVRRGNIFWKSYGFFPILILRKRRILFCIILLFRMLPQNSWKTGIRS